MPVEYNRKQIADGVYLSTVHDEKFKTNYISVQFVSDFEVKEASARALIPNILTVSNSKYPTREALSTKLASLYNASLSDTETIVGNSYVSTLFASCIADCNTIDGEKITAELANILITSIFSPKTVNGAFDETEFAILKKELLDEIDTEINNKRNYALKQARKTIYCGEKSASGVYGSRKEAEALTCEYVYELYLSMLESSHIEIILGSSENVDETAELLERAFSDIPRKNVYRPVYYEASPLKPKTENVTERMDVKQTRLVMAYKIGKTDLYAAKIFTALFGITPTSKLFMNVREKMSLCYSCSAAYDECRQTLIVECGIDDANLDKTIAAINEQLRSLADGDFTDDELNDTKLMMTGAFRSNYDSLYGLMNWYNVQYRRGTALSPDEVIVKLNAITREDVVLCAQGFELDTVYALRTSLASVSQLSQSAAENEKGDTV